MSPSRVSHSPEDACNGRILISVFVCVASLRRLIQWENTCTSFSQALVEEGGVRYPAVCVCGLTCLKRILILLRIVSNMFYVLMYSRHMDVIVKWNFPCRQNDSIHHVGGSTHQRLPQLTGGLIAPLLNGANDFFPIQPLLLEHLENFEGSFNHKCVKDLETLVNARQKLWVKKTIVLLKSFQVYPLKQL